MKKYQILGWFTAVILGFNKCYGIPSSAPENDSVTVQLIQPQVIEVQAITPFGPNDVDDLTNYIAQITNSSSYQIIANGQPITCTAAGIQRRPTYAVLNQWDLRVRFSIYLLTGSPIADTNTLSVGINVPGFWQTNLNTQLTVTRTNPAIHISWAGYPASLPKRAMVGYFLGTLGEMPTAVTNTFSLVDNTTGNIVYTGKLTRRLDSNFETTAYQNVLEANFDAFTTAGIYRLYVPGMGMSEPFHIGDQFGALLSRTYALGLLQQRCGMDVGLPETRFSHDACHTRPALVPNENMVGFSNILATLNSGITIQTNQILITNLTSCLFPYVNTNPVNVTGGHHDAGDYSKYTPNCASLANTLIFAVDNFPGVNQLDNLGVPESGDGIPDLLQEAKWETDYIIKLQDADGGFYSIVYPESRKYEVDCLPDDGDNQVVYPKTTTATAAAVAVLAQAASSPMFKHYYPSVATNYLAAALKGWAFLSNAFAMYGQNGAMQYMKGSYYGQNDNLAWAYAELYLATTNQMFHDALRDFYTPGDPATCHWTWWHMDQGYGRAVRSYAFAAENGRMSSSLLDSNYLALCDQEITNWAATVTSYADQSAYGSSFPWESKHMNASGWYFSSGQAFDIATGLLLQTNQDWQAALISNLAYESGCNPLNQSYVSGIGGRRYKNTISQYTENDKRQVAATGIPIGNIQSGFVPVNSYPLENLSLPWDSAVSSGCPMYDRGADVPNVLTEATGMDQAKALAVSAFLMGNTSYKTQAWVPATTTNTIALVTETNGNVLCTLQSTVSYTNDVQPVWESFDNALGTTTTYQHQVFTTGDQWIEAEFLLPDGRRLSAATTFPATAPVVAGEDTVSITAINPTAALTSKTQGLIRISRTQSADALTINYAFAGARNGVDCAWLNGSDYGSYWGTLTLPVGSNSVDIQVLAAQPPDDFSTKTLTVTLLPGDYNVTYPSAASVTIIRTNVPASATTVATTTSTSVSATTVSTASTSSASVNGIPAYSTPKPIANPPALGIPAAVTAAMANATNIDQYFFYDATNSTFAYSATGYLPPLQLTNAISSSGVLQLTNWTSLATNVCTLTKGTNLHGLIFKTSIYISSYNSYGQSDAFMFSIYQNWYCYLELYEDKWATNSIVRGAYQTNVVTGPVLGQYLTTKTWHDFAMQLDTWGYVIYVDGSPVAALPSTDLTLWQKNKPLSITLGQFNGAMRQVQIQSY